MSEFAGILPRKFISFRLLGVKSSPHKLPDERKSESTQKVAERDEVNTVVVGETSSSPAKVMSMLQNVSVLSEVVMSGEVQKDQELTVAEKDCVMTSSEEDMDDLNSFVNEKLQFVTEKGLEQLVGDESVNVEEILSENVGTVGPEIDQGRTTSVFPGLTSSANVEGSSCEVSFHERDEVDRILREEMGGSRVTSFLVKGLWPTYSKRWISVLGENGVPPCKTIKFGVPGAIESVEGGNLSRSGRTGVSGGVEGEEFTSGGFSTLEATAKKRADERDGGLCELSSGDGMVCVPQVESIV